MKTLTLNNRTFLAWPVPMGAKRPFINGYASHIIYEDPSFFFEANKLPLPLAPGTYSEPFLLSQIDEERVYGMMDFTLLDGHRQWRNYTFTANVKQLPTAHESFHSWLSANGVFVVNPMGENMPEMAESSFIPNYKPYGMGDETYDYERRKAFHARERQEDRFSRHLREWRDYEDAVSKEWILIEQLTIC